MVTFRFRVKTIPAVLMLLVLATSNALARVPFAAGESSVSGEQACEMYRRLSTEMKASPSTRARVDIASLLMGVGIGTGVSGAALAVASTVHERTLMRQALAGAVSVTHAHAERIARSAAALLLQDEAFQVFYHQVINQVTRPGFSGNVQGTLARALSEVFGDIDVIARLEKKLLSSGVSKESAAAIIDDAVRFFSNLGSNPAFADDRAKLGSELSISKIAFINASQIRTAIATMLEKGILTTPSVLGEATLLAGAEGAALRTAQRAARCGKIVGKGMAALGAFATIIGMIAEPSNTGANQENSTMSLDVNYRRNPGLLFQRDEQYACSWLESDEDLRERFYFMAESIRAKSKPIDSCEGPEQSDRADTGTSEVVSPSSKPLKSIARPAS
jgi:hypothetical protein